MATSNTPEGDRLHALFLKGLADLRPRCLSCHRHIKMMCRRGTGYCCMFCEDDQLGKR